MELSTVKCEFLYVECFQTFSCIHRLFFNFSSVLHNSFYLYFSMAAISGISVLAVLLALFCCTCYSVVFLSQYIDHDDDDDDDETVSSP